MPDGAIPECPYDVVVARSERRPIQGSDGAIRTPAKAFAAHYHVCLSCVRVADPSFDPSMLGIEDVLTPEHISFINLNLGIIQSIHYLVI